MQRVIIPSWRRKPQPQPFLAPLAPRKGLIGGVCAIVGRCHAATAAGVLLLGGCITIGAFAVFLFSQGSPDDQQTEASFLPNDQPAEMAPASGERVEEEVAAVTSADLPAFAPDPGETASIAATRQSVDLPPVGTPLALMPAVQANAAVAALNAVRPGEDDGVPVPTMKPESSVAATASAEPSAAMKNGVTNRAVNMRASPRAGASVLGVVPAQTALKIEQGCRDWCAVSYDGRSGYIYKSFISYR